MDKVRWGILGAGGIAHRFARALEHVDDASLVAISGRNAARLDEFAAEYPVEPHKRYVSDEDNGEGAHQMLVDDPDIDAVYLALPHGLHEVWACRLLEAGKAVLCEKPATLSAKQAQHVVDVARTNKALFVEAMKPRFMPVRARVHEILASGELGAICRLKVVHRLDYGDLGDSYLFDPVQGGTLYDIGCYGVAWAEDLLAGEIEVKRAEVEWLPVAGGLRADIAEGSRLDATDFSRADAAEGSRVDIAEKAQLNIGGIPVSFDFAGNSKDYCVELCITCEHGKICMPMFHRPQGFTVKHFDAVEDSIENYAEEHIEAPLAVDDFYDEVAHACALIREGACESPLMSLDSSVRVAQIIDAIRAALPLHAEHTAENTAKGDN